MVLSPLDFGQLSVHDWTNTSGLVPMVKIRCPVLGKVVKEHGAGLENRVTKHGFVSSS